MSTTTSTMPPGEGPSVPVVIRGRVVGRIAVKDILPPRRRRAKAEGQGA